MDALCIDQSTTQEKNHQVGMMGQIYARSAHVLACVGPHTHGSTSLFWIIDKMRSLLGDIHRLTLESTVEDTRTWVVPNPIPKSSRVAPRCLFEISFYRRQALLTEFIEFLKRPYFSRVWVLQELFLAPRISLCCGMDIRSFDVLLAVSMLIDFWINTSDYEDALSLSRVSSIAYKVARDNSFSLRQTSWSAFQADFRNIQPQIGCLALASGVRGRRRLAEVLEAMQSFQCTDIRDRLFGVLALVEWGSGKPALPDYGKDNYQVAIEVLRLYLQNSGTEPVSGVPIEWPLRLWELFDLKVEGRAMQEEIVKRCGSHLIPRFLMFASDSMRCFNMVRLNDEKDGRNPPTRYQSYPGYPRDKWYGVRLLNANTLGVDNGVRSLTDTKPYYLCCKAKDRSALSFVEVLENGRDLFAYAPADTRPNDWLLISETSYCTHAMVVVRRSSARRGIYVMVGQAFEYDGHRRTILPYLDWKYFGSNWHAEDLFFFHLTLVTHVWCARTAETAPDWLRMRTNACQDSSFFYGHVTKSELDVSSECDQPTPCAVQRRPTQHVFTAEKLWAMNHWKSTERDASIDSHNTARTPQSLKERLQQSYRNPFE